MRAEFSQPRRVHARFGARGPAAVVAVLTLAALALAGRAAPAASPDLPPVPPVWAPVTEIAPAPAPRGSWGMDVGVGPANVRVHVPDAYARAPEMAVAFARWATFLGTLLHGDELGNATLAFALSEQMAKACGDRETVACYSPRQSPPRAV